MEAPKHLSHKPIIAVNDYDKMDGMYANNSDVVELSIGFAQYNDSDISAKVWRYNQGSERWSSQSEVLPIHKVIDLSLAAIASFIADDESNFALTNLKETIVDNENVKCLKEYYKENNLKILLRIKELKRVIELFENNKTPFK